jgi:hypothetical protein
MQLRNQPGESAVKMYKHPPKSCQGKKGKTVSIRERFRKTGSFLPLPDSGRERTEFAAPALFSTLVRLNLDQAAKDLII